MKSVIKIFGVLFILLVQFTSCLDIDNDNKEKPIYYFYNEPVAVVRTGEYPFIRNESYLFYVPELVENTALKEGNLLWTSFFVDLDSQVSTDLITYAYQYTAEHFKYEIIDSAKVIIPADAEEFQSYMSDDYSAPIESSVMYKYAIDSLWFFGLRQKDESNQLSHTYELILNPEIESGSSSYPTFYIRSKQMNIPGENSGKARSKDGNIFAFDVTDFVNYYRNAISSTGFVQFNIKYKTGVDTNGNDIYKEFMSNPISWDFNSKKTSTD